MSPKLYIPIGIPGSGKSTWCREHLRAITVSTDAIREQMGDVSDQSRNDEVFRLYHEKIQDRLTKGYSVVADATNLTYRARLALYARAQIADASVHLILFRNLSEAVARNKARERTVPGEAMIRMLDNFERTLRDLPAEREYYKSITEIASLG